jgi:hypothetical protein
VYRKKPHILFCCLAILVFGISSGHLPVPSTDHLQNDGWTVPQNIPGYDKSAWPPILVADQNRQVHAFSSQWINDGTGTEYSSIVYNRWTFKDGWTQPIDILLSPSGEARLTDAYLDRNGTVHIIFWAGDNTAANLYHSQSDLSVVGQIQSWSTPVQVAEDVGDPPSADLVENNTGDLLLVYHGQIFGGGVYIIKSQDNGGTWSRPNPIFLTNSEAPLAWNIQTTRGSSDWLHIIWNVLNESGQGRGIYYARTQNGDEWSAPVLLDYAQEGYGTQTPAIVEYNNMLLAFFSGIYMRSSLDNGETWGDSGRIFFRHVGVNGSLAPVIDGNGALHLFFGQRITGNPDIHGMWHSTFENGRWTEPDAVVKGPQVVDREGDNSFDPYEARAVVSQGNVLLVAWRMDPGLRGNGIWYSYKTLDIPESPSPSSGPDNPSTASSISGSDGQNEQGEPIATEVPIEKNNNQLVDTNQSTIFSFGYLITLGVLPVLLFIIILIASRFRSANR